MPLLQIRPLMTTVIHGSYTVRQSAAAVGTWQAPGARAPCPAAPGQAQIAQQFLGSELHEIIVVPCGTMLSGQIVPRYPAPFQKDVSAFLQRRLQAVVPIRSQTCHKVRSLVTATAEAQSAIYRVASHERHQRALTKVESNKLRKASQQLGKDICTVTVGRAGITLNTIISLGDALAGNELVKVSRAPTPHLPPSSRSRPPSWRSVGKR